MIEQPVLVVRRRQTPLALHGVAACDSSACARTAWRCRALAAVGCSPEPTPTSTQPAGKRCVATTGVRLTKPACFPRRAWCWLAARWRRSAAHLCAAAPALRLTGGLGVRLQANEFAALGAPAAASWPAKPACLCRGFQPPPAPPPHRHPAGCAPRSCSRSAPHGSPSQAPHACAPRCRRPARPPGGPGRSPR